MRLVEWFNHLNASLNKDNISELAILMKIKATPFRVQHLYEVLRALHAINRHDLLPSYEDVKSWIEKGEVLP